VSSNLLELFPYLYITSDIISKSDIVITFLSMYRFLLIRDKQTNYTGVWKSENLNTVKNEFLDPLQKVADEEIEKLSKPETKKEKKRRNELARIYQLPDVSEQELEQYNQRALTTLQMIVDMISRVKELVAGKSPFEGRPEPLPPAKTEPQKSPTSETQK